MLRRQLWPSANPPKLKWMLKRPVIVLLIFLTLPMFVGCQTSAAKDFARLKPGMEKHDVLEIMGDPQRKIRRKGSDQWTFVYYDNRVRTENEVHFTEGVATYVGPHVPPLISAEQQDAIYAAENKEVERRLTEKREQAQTNLHRYEEEVRGTDTSVEESVPQYEPIK